MDKYSYQLNRIIQLLEQILATVGASEIEKEVQCYVDGTRYHKSISAGCPRCGVTMTLEQWKKQNE